MSAVPVYDEALERLGRGDRVAALEELKRRAVSLAQRLEQQLGAEQEDAATDEERRDAFLEAASEPAEELIAAAIPLIEYGGADDHAAVAQALQHVVDRVAAAEGAPQISQISAVVVLGRIVWSLATYTLSCRRLDALVALASVGTLPRYYDERPVLPVIDDRSYRYPAALGGNAGHSYRNYQEWLATRELVRERLAYLAVALELTFGEADLLLALRMHGQNRGRTYSGGMRNNIVRRLALRFRDRRQRQYLAEFFGVHDAALDELVDGAYVALEHDRDLMAPDLPARMLGGA